MPLSHQRFSDLIGAIYDCAIDPELWPTAIEKICQETRCVSGVIHVVDSQLSTNEFVKSWNYDLDIPESYVDLLTQYFKLISGFLLTHPMDEPYAGSRFDYSPLFAGKSPIYSHMGIEHPRLEKASSSGDLPNGILGTTVDWRRKYGHIDNLSSIVLRDRSRIGLFSVVRDQAGGFATDDDLAILGMLAPHIRRAITISDLLNLKAVEAQALAATLDKLALGVVIVAADRRILHANEVAKRMFAAGRPFRSVQGRLIASGAANEELAKAIGLAENEVDIGKVGIAIALRTSSGEPAVAHVLPLARGDVRSRLLPQAAAAIFITQSGGRSPAALSGFAEIFKLTPAEIRVLHQLIHGDATMIEVASRLSVSEATAKTHLSHILAKTGVSRQAELVALVRDFLPPVGGDND